MIAGFHYRANEISKRFVQRIRYIYEMLLQALEYFHEPVYAKYEIITDLSGKEVIIWEIFFTLKFFPFDTIEKSLSMLVWEKPVTKISLFLWLIRHVLHRVKGDSGKGGLIFPTR